MEPSHALAILAMNDCYLVSKVTTTGVSCVFPVSAHLRVFSSRPRVDLACWLSRRWRSSHRLHLFKSHQHSLRSSLGAWTQAICTAQTHAGRTPCVSVSDRSHHSVALSFFMHWSWCCLNLRWVSIQTPSNLVAYLLNMTKLVPTQILAGSFRCWCYVWTHQYVKSTVWVFAVSNTSSSHSAQMLLT